MKKILIVALASAACTLGSSAAMAAYVTDYDGAVLLGSWNQSLTPTPVSFVTGSHTEVPITDGTGAVAGYSTAFWYGAGDHGGLLAGDIALSPINTGGPVSYIGTEAAPIFIPGVYHEDDGTIVTISVPEPASWAMMLVGMGLVGFAARRRRNVTVRYG